MAEKRAGWARLSQLNTPLSRSQITSFDWKAESGTVDLHKLVVQPKLEAAEKARHQILALGDVTDNDRKRMLHKEAEEALADVRLLGDLVVGAFFQGDSVRERERRRQGYMEPVKLWLQGERDRREALAAEVEALREGEKPILPFHWEIELPEVFRRANPGLDAFVGNPPFAGKNNLIKGNREGYLEWLKLVHEGAHGISDLVAHFFRRTYAMLRDGGTFGLIATNTIGQGDTRSTGLRHIRAHGGHIYSATKRLKWPGAAAVVVSVVHGVKGPYGGEAKLNGKPVERITAFLVSRGGDDDPPPLKENEGKSFIGSYVLGMGFTFDDSSEEATPIVEMERLIQKDPRNRERIFPYLGGEEVNSSPTHSHTRYVINFGEMVEEDARGWPDLMRIVEARVKPERMRQNDAFGRRRWWQFMRTRPELHEKLDGLSRTLVIARVSRTAAFTFVGTSQVLNEKLVVFPSDRQELFAVLQSRTHECWARFFSSTLKDDLQYTPSECFDTFPFPINWQHNPILESAGQAYYDFRAALMVRNNQGLTDTYNRFHSPDEAAPEIHRLRELHAAMDRVVLDAYGWTDLKPQCDFFLDYEEEDDEDTVGERQKRKPYRYRWPDEAQDEILARLLELNKERAEKESRSAADLASANRSAAHVNATRKRSAGRPKKDRYQNVPFIPGLNIPPPTEPS